MAVLLREHAAINQEEKSSTTYALTPKPVWPYSPEPHEYTLPDTENSTKDMLLAKTNETNDGEPTCECEVVTLTAGDHSCRLGKLDKFGRVEEVLLLVC